MAVFKGSKLGSTVAFTGDYIDPDQLGSGKGSPQGKKFLTDNQTFTAVDATQVDSGAATSGQVLTADGLGGASWQDGGATRTIRYYTASDTWSKPSGLLGLWAIVISGGGGGGSGRRGAASTRRSGGGGGGGSPWVWSFIHADDLGASETVTVGSGGPGGAAVTTDYTNGNSGGSGGASSFGSHVVSIGGNGGNGGVSSTTANGGSSILTGYTPVLGWGSIWGGMGSPGRSTSIPSANGVFLDYGTDNRTPGGGGGGGINNTNAIYDGGTGGTYATDSVGSPTEAAGGTTAGTRDGADGGTQPAGDWFFDTDLAFTSGHGGGGGGGAAGDTAGTIGGGAGGNGGNYGGPGGGGGASTNGANSGAGGDGGDGLVIVVEVTA